MSAPRPRYINRELSWLEFNQRVLDEARDESVPLLERLRFLAITASNLDEFFMVRVGGLQMLAGQGRRQRDPAGLTPQQQLEAVSVRTHEIVAQEYRCYLSGLEPLLAEAGIRRVRADELADEQLKALVHVFDQEISSVLTPMAVEGGEQFPLLAGGVLHVCVRLGPALSGSHAPRENQPARRSASRAGEPRAAGRDAERPGSRSHAERGDESDESEPRFAVIPFGPAARRFLTLPAESGHAYALLEDVVALFAERFFPGQQIVECVPFRITRNADLSVREDQAADLLAEMEEILDARKRSACVRLEIADNVTTKTRRFLQQELGVPDREVYAIPGPLDLSAFTRLADLGGFEELRYEAWPPQPSPDVDLKASLFETLSRRDVLLCHPFESFEPLVRLLDEAADDPDVLALKQTLYRTSRDSPVVAALARAAENGKSVAAIVELKARFDEARNIEWVRNLELAGVQVIYGVKGLKTHAKVCVIIRREPQGIARYVHFGTGNYNEITARLYTDVSFLTSNGELAADATSFFNAVSGYSEPQEFRHIEAAPVGLRERLLEMIAVETQRAREGRRAAVTAKMNSLVDPQVIDALYEASSAGVKVRLCVRGICCLRPGVEGLSENIHVVSIIDRFLEHSRILCFHHGGDQRVFISSADWMPRNLDRRVELMVPVEDPHCKRKLLDVLEAQFQDNVKARRLLADGTYERSGPAAGDVAFRSQKVLYRRACEALRRAEQSRRTTFEPHRAPGAAG